jgi:hypothetical protein
MEQSKFIQSLTVASKGNVIASPIIKLTTANSPNEIVNNVVVAIRSRGKDHVHTPPKYAGQFLYPKNFIT